MNQGKVSRAEEKLPHMRAPVLIVRGSRDLICPQHRVKRVKRVAECGKQQLKPYRIQSQY